MSNHKETQNRCVLVSSILAHDGGGIREGTLFCLKIGDCSQLDFTSHSHTHQSRPNRRSVTRNLQQAGRILSQTVTHNIKKQLRSLYFTETDITLHRNLLDPQFLISKESKGLAGPKTRNRLLSPVCWTADNIALFCQQHEQDAQAWLDILSRNDAGHAVTNSAFTPSLSLSSIALSSAKQSQCSGYA